MLPTQKIEFTAGGQPFDFLGKIRKGIQPEGT